MMMEEEIFFCDEDKEEDYKEEMNQLEKEIDTLRTLTENGVGKRFDLYEYSQKKPQNPMLVVLFFDESDE